MPTLTIVSVCARGAERSTTYASLAESEGDGCRKKYEEEGKGGCQEEECGSD